MRYEKKVMLLAGLLAVLLLTWGAGAFFSPERMAARSESARLISGKAADVASISLKAAGGAMIELAKSGSSWVLVDGQARFPVQAGRVSSFIDEIAGISRLKPVAHSKESWAGFQLDDAQAKRATLRDASGKVLADLFVGGYGPTGSEVYLRRSPSDTSYTAETGIVSYVGYGRSTWLDLKVLGDVKESEVQSFSVKCPSLSFLDAGKPAGEKGKAAAGLDYSLRRDGQGWKAGAAQIDADGASALLRSILGLQGEDYVASPPADAFAKPGARIELELGSGRALVMVVGSSAGPDRFYARIEGKPLVFLASSFNLRNCLKSLGDLSAKK
jgi:Domain of unknown function (DUF4340)